MKVIGLTGGIASGKNFIAEIFAKKGAAIFDADKEVHKLLASHKSTIDEVKKEFAESFVNRKIDRKILGEIVFSDLKKLKILEKILHPQIKKKYQEFLKKAKKAKEDLVVLNVPLLLESGGYKCDSIVAVIASKKIRKARFLERAKVKSAGKKYEKKDQTEKKLAKKFEQIYSKQMNDSERRKSADFIIKNNSSKSDAAKQISKYLQSLKNIGNKFSTEALVKIKRTYNSSFIESERRDFSLLEKMIIEEPRFSLHPLYSKNLYIGFISEWNFETFSYLEHFAIEESFRNQGMGEAMLKQFLSSIINRPVVIEIPAPKDEISLRREAFYKRLGFVTNKNPYLQPPYQKNGNWLEMRLMSYGDIDLDSNYDMIKDILYKNVYGISV